MRGVFVVFIHDPGAVAIEDDPNEVIEQNVIRFLNASADCNIKGD